MRKRCAVQPGAHTDAALGQPLGEDFTGNLRMPERQYSALPRIRKGLDSLNLFQPMRELVFKQAFVLRDVVHTLAKQIAQPSREPRNTGTFGVPLSKRSGSSAG